MSKNIVVVGASRGIGKALVEKFATEANHNVYALSRNIEAMNASFGHLENVTTIALDLNSATLEEDLKSAFGNITSVDILINNAGYLVNKPFAEIKPADMVKSYQINVIGVMQTVQAALEKLNPNAHIVNISSVGGFQGSVKFPGLSSYSTSKAAVASFTELFAEEYNESSFKINCLCLGSVQTEMLEEAFPGYKALVSPEQMAEYISQFAHTAHQWMNGKIIPVSLTTP
mgnify:CR=1 FL=1